MRMGTVINIGNRREVFWDSYLIDEGRTTAELKVCPVEERTTVAEIDDSVIVYPTVCKVGDLLRLNTFV